MEPETYTKWYTVYDGTQYGPFPNKETALSFHRFISTTGRDFYGAFTWGVTE